MNFTAKQILVKSLCILCIFSLITLTACEKEQEVPEPEKDTQVFISEPPYDRHFLESELPLTMKASAMAFNGDFSNKVTWTSDRDGNLGIGSEITVSLSPGRHIIKAYADNGHIPGTYEIPVTIDADPKKMDFGPPKDIIVKTPDRDGALFIINRTKQVITDTSTGLMWDRTPDTYVYTYAQAVDYAKKSKLGGYTDWRLPTIEEFVDIHNLYYDGREAILHDEFGSFVGKFWTQTLVDKKSGAHRFTIEQKDITGGVRDDFLSEKGYADERSRLHVRLVRRAR